MIGPRSHAPHAVSRLHRLARRCAFALLGCVLASPLHAQAPPHHHYALNWVRARGAEACISSSELAQRIEALIGPVFRAPDAADRAIEGMVEPSESGAGFAVHIRIAERDGESLGERMFESAAATCEELNDSIVLVTVLMVDPSASERGLPPELLGMLQDDATPGADLLDDLERERADRAERAPAPKPVEQARPAPKAEPWHAPPQPEASEERRKPSRATFGLDLALAGAIAYEVLPDLKLGGGLTARLSTPFVIGFELGLGTWQPGEVTLTDDMGRRSVTTFGATTAQLAACLPITSTGDLEVTACAGAALVARWFDSDLLNGSYERRHAQLGPIMGIDARDLFARHWFLLATVNGLAMLPGTSFFYTSGSGRALLYEPATFGLWLALGAGARL